MSHTAESAASDASRLSAAPADSASTGSAPRPREPQHFFRCRRLLKSGRHPAPRAERRSRAPHEPQDHHAHSQRFFDSPVTDPGSGKPREITVCTTGKTPSVLEMSLWHQEERSQPCTLTRSMRARAPPADVRPWPLCGGATAMSAALRRSHSRTIAVTHDPGRP